MNRDLVELLKGAGLEHIVIPRKDFIEEHRHLIGLLNQYDIPKLRKEASSQKKELDKMMKGGKWSGGPKAGFIRRLMAENKKKRLEEGEEEPYGRPVWRLSDTNRPDEKITPMKQPWKFKYTEIANRQQNGKNRSEYGASPFLIRHFGNVREEDEDDEDEDNAPPPPPSDIPLRESAEQKNARKSKYPDSALRPFRGKKKEAQPVVEAPVSSSSSSTPMGEVLPEAEPVDSEKVKAEKEVLEDISKNRFGSIEPRFFKPLFEVDKEWIALKKKSEPIKDPKTNKVRQRLLTPKEMRDEMRKKEEIEIRIIDDFYETPRGVEALILQNEVSTQGYKGADVKRIERINERRRRDILKAIEKEQGKEGKKPNRDIVRKVIDEEEELEDEEAPRVSSSSSSSSSPTQKEVSKKEAIEAKMREVGDDEKYQESPKAKKENPQVASAQRWEGKRLEDEKLDTLRGVLSNLGGRPDYFEDKKRKFYPKPRVIEKIKERIREILKK